jgi:hypothetical protein
MHSRVPAQLRLQACSRAANEPRTHNQRPGMLQLLIESQFWESPAGKQCSTIHSYQQHHKNQGSSAQGRSHQNHGPGTATTLTCAASSFRCKHLGKSHKTLDQRVLVPLALRHLQWVVHWGQPQRPVATCAPVQEGAVDDTVVHEHRSRRLAANRATVDGPLRHSRVVAAEHPNVHGQPAQGHHRYSGKL